ncbi:MAG TPA: hypothetical protein PLM14_02955 [Candidatus Hydrogenedentes bacterium]|nr:hypothetical protein [Candidatus Hydrogenedentota bacterium]HQH54204.1 hypothetical protein [Candidatus Hydrogenedentota bacterium]
MARVLQAWLAERGAQAICITPGSPWENPQAYKVLDVNRTDVTTVEEIVDVMRGKDGCDRRTLRVPWRRKWKIPG